MSTPEQILHTAICQAVTLMNVSATARGSEEHNILRQALVDYADAVMDQPTDEKEQRVMRQKQRVKP